MESEILKGNKLIAEFMGVDFSMPHDHEGIYLYDRSWDWLMPVVEKIETMSNYSRNNKVYFHDFKFISNKDDINVQFNIHNKNPSIFVFEYLQCEKYTQKIYFQFESINIAEISKTDTKTWRTKIENCYLCVIEFIKWYNIKNELSNN